jgi:hypothetical protein
LNAKYGNIGYIKEVMAAYRIHSEGVWSMQLEKNFLRNMVGWIDLYKNIDVHFNSKYNSVIKRRIYVHELALYKWYVKNKYLKLAIKQLASIIVKYPVLMIKHKIRYELSKFSPKLYASL